VWLVVHEVSALQSGPSDNLFEKMVDEPEQAENHWSSAKSLLSKVTLLIKKHTNWPFCRV